MTQNNSKQIAFDFFQTQNFTSVDSAIERINLKTQNALGGIKEFNLTCRYASELISSTLHTARQIFESHFDANELQSQEALWHSYARAYTLRVEHELDQLGKYIIRSLNIDPINLFIKRGMYEINSLANMIQKKVR